METPVPPSMQDQQEALWLQQLARNGRDANAALRALTLAYNKRFLAFLWQRGFSAERRDDLLQEVWTAVVRGAAGFDVGRTPSSWLWKILRNKVADALRQYIDKDRKTLSDSDEAVLDEAEGQAWRQGSPPRLALDRCLREALDAMKAKHPKEAVALYLRHLENWTAQQVAEYRGGTAQAAREFLSQARRKFANFAERCQHLLPDPHR